MYAKIAMTTWDSGQPAKSWVAGTDSEDAFGFEHDYGCPVHTGPSRYQECRCYVSRIRLVKTPVGRTIPTTEKDLGPELVFWHNEAERLQRSNAVLAICLMVSAACGIATAIGFAYERGVLG